MKRNTITAFLVLTNLFAVLLTGGCGQVGSSDDAPYLNIRLEEEVHLTGDASSPFCDISIDYSCLNEKGDSIASLINRCIQSEFLGEDYASLTPQAAVDSFKNVYARDYRQEVGKIYLADKAQAASEDEIPAWYNQTYSLLTFVDEGHGGTVNATANIFVDTGGAHPQQWARWLNFDFVSGQLLTLEEVFLPSAKTDIESLLLEKLIRQQAEQHPEENVTSLEDLQKLGFLQLTGIYIPENFLLAKDAVIFLFNRYDIAPYSAGEIVLHAPYEEIGAYLIKR